MPLLVVVTGMPSSGKTTVAEGLAGRLQLPLIAKDDIKESLYDSLGAEGAELGAAAYALIFALARATLEAGASLIVEANFFTDQAADFSALPDHRTVQIHCRAPLPALLERYAGRSRHAGHRDAEKIKELPARFESGAHDPLALDGELIRLDTTEPVDLDALASACRGSRRD